MPDGRKRCEIIMSRRHLIGRLRSSITHETEGTAGRVGTNVTYAKYVELGTEKQSPQPFLRPALHKNEKRILALFKKII